MVLSFFQEYFFVMLLQLFLRENFDNNFRSFKKNGGKLKKLFFVEHIKLEFLDEAPSVFYSLSFFEKTTENSLKNAFSRVIYMKLD